jgi:adenylate kinase
MMKIILLGLPGSGKGTQAELIQKKYGFPKISSGDLLRREVQEGTDLGKKAESFMNRGGLVSDDIVAEMVKKRISLPDCKRGYILDGFPRNIAQAHRLEKMAGKSPEIAIEIHLSEKTLVSRLASRRICSRCGAIYSSETQNPKKEGICDVCQGALIQRKDDTAPVIEKRLRVYEAETAALIDYYRRKGVYQRIDGEGKVETVFGQVCSILDREILKSREVEAAR